jgi:hypothetical protein
MRYVSRFILASGAIIVASCADPTSVPNESTPSPGTSLSAGLSPNRNLEIILRGAGFGHVKFRQPKDDATIIYLDTWVRDLKPNTNYQLQRATDFVIDDVCTGGTTNPADWLTLGQGLTPKAITTDERGTGREALFRTLPLTFVGAVFDIHFRVVEQATQVVVLESECYQFEVSL